MWNDREATDIFLSLVHQTIGITTLIHGGAKGADTMCGEWAERNGIPIIVFGIDQYQWKRYGPKAGPRRNQRMLDEGEPDVLLAFYGGRGTEDMKRRAAKAGIPIYDIAEFDTE